MTRLKSISIKNFKAYKSLQEIPLKPITLIFGPNSAGKSTITHALAFLKNAHLKNGDCSPDEVDLVWDKVTLGSWQNLLHGHDPKQNMQLGLNFGEDVSAQWTFEGSNQGPRASKCIIAQGGSPLSSAVNEKPNGLMWKITHHDQHPHRTNLANRIWSYLWCGKDFVVVPRTHKDSAKLPWEQFYIQFLEYLAMHPITAAGLFPGALNEKRRKQLENDRWESGPMEFETVWTTTLPSGGKTESDGNAIRECLLVALESGDGINSHLQELFNHCMDVASCNEDISYAIGVREFEQLFQSHVHLGPSRKAPPRDIDRQSLDNNSRFGPWLELLENKELRDQVNQALERLGLNYNLVTRWKDTITYFPETGDTAPAYDSRNVEFNDPKKQLAFQIKGTRVTLSHRDLGYGVSMVLPILVALHSSKFRLITMEQPELHLHPKQQAELGDELITAALRAASKLDEPKQLIVETHSEHLILRILRRIRETTEGEIDDWPSALRKACPSGIKPEDVAILYVQPGENGSEVIPLPIDAHGEFTCEWPGGFFEERMKELF